MPRKKAKKKAKRKATRKKAASRRTAPAKSKPGSTGFLKAELVVVEAALQDLMGKQDPESVRLLAEIEGKNAQRCHLKSRLAKTATDAVRWAKQERDARKNQASALDKLWSERLAAALTRAEANDQFRATFAAKHEELGLGPH